MNNDIFSSLDTWKAADFNSLLKELDLIASEIANEKDHGDLSRKILIEKNKKFKEQVSLDTRKEVAPLLKCFQNEVDHFNKRNKSLETSLLMLYKRMIDLPDPCPALETALAAHKKLHKMQDITLENRKLREALEDYQREFSDVKNQEFTIKQLKDKIKELENNMVNNIEVRCKERERELTNEFAEKERDINNECSDALRRLKDSETKLDISEKALTDSQEEMFQMKMKLDEFSAAKSAEIDILLGENERAVERVKQLENKLCTQSSGSDHRLVLGDYNRISAADTNNIAEMNEMKLELATKENEVVKLSEEVRRAHLLFSQNERSMQEQINQIETEMVKKTEIIESLQMRLNSQNDYNELKREMEIIKSMEFSDISQEDSSGTAEDGGDRSSSSRTLEHLLMQKNRHLQSELLQAKAANVHSQVNLEKITDDHNEAKRIIREQKQLIDQLEDDLHKMKTFSLSIRGSGEGADESTSQLSQSDCSSPITKVNEASMLANVLENKSDSHVDVGSNSLLSIVQSQRDRYKVRAQELEGTCNSHEKSIQCLQAEVEHIKKDNVKLYEKVRFLQSYSRNSEKPTDDGIMSRYSEEYEAKLNPFESFHRRERQRQYQSLPPHEKIMLSLGQFVMGNRTARLFAFLYSLLLHFLIFTVLYKLAYTEACVRDQAVACRKEFADHMVRAHGGVHR